MLWGCVGTSVQLVRKGSLHFMIQLFCGKCPPSWYISPASYYGNIHLLVGVPAGQKVKLLHIGYFFHDGLIILEVCLRHAYVSCNESRSYNLHFPTYPMQHLLYSWSQMRYGVCLLAVVTCLMLTTSAPLLICHRIFVDSRACGFNSGTLLVSL